MNVEIIKLELERDNKGMAVFSDKNLELLVKYVIPVIEKNRGWGTEDLTREDFIKNTEKWRSEINATVECGANAEVFIALVDDEPVGLLEYQQSDFSNLAEEGFSKVLSDMLDNRSSEYWRHLENPNVADSKVIDKYHSELKDFVLSKKLYYNIGIVLKPDLQGRSLGISDWLYEKLEGGFIMGWTSTPLTVAKRRKLYAYTLFFPVFEGEVNSLVSLGCLTVVAARRIARHPNLPGRFRFGVSKQKGFPTRNEEEYVGLAKELLIKSKINELDYKRLGYILEIEGAQGAIISVA